MTKQDVHIIGGGVAGLTAAIAFQSRGFSCSIYEAAKKFNEVGAGIQLSANATCVLQSLDVDLEAGNRASKIAIYSQKGRHLLSAKVDTKKAPYLHIHRADLITALAKRVEELGVNFAFGKKIKPSDLPEDALKIVASGVHASGNAIFSGYGAWRATLPLGAHEPPRTEVFIGKDRHVVLYPLKQRGLLNIVAVSKAPDWHSTDWQAAGSTSDMLNDFSEFPDWLRQLFSHIDAPMRWALLAHQEPVFQGEDDTILIGDAAMASVPFMAQGAAMAIEDAMILARCADKYDRDVLGEVFTDLRFARRKNVVIAAHKNADLFHQNIRMPAGMQAIGMKLAGRLVPNLIQKRYDWIYNFDATALDI